MTGPRSVRVRPSPLAPNHTKGDEVDIQEAIRNREKFAVKAQEYSDANDRLTAKTSEIRIISRNVENFDPGDPGLIDKDPTLYWAVQDADSMQNVILDLEEDIDRLSEQWNELLDQIRESDELVIALGSALSNEAFKRLRRRLDKR